MKRLLKMILSLITCFSVAGCASGSGSYIDESDPEIMAEDLADRIEEGIDNGDVSDQFIDTEDSEEDITQFENQIVEELDTDEYDNRVVTVVEELPEDDLYYISIVYYTVAGTHPDTDNENMSYSGTVKEQDGELYFTGSSSDMQKMSDVMIEDTDIFPSDLLEAIKAGRNSQLIDPNNYMWLNEDEPVYEGATTINGKFAWQNEDGSVDMVLLIQNGTDKNIYYSDGTVTLTDQSLGEIGSWDIDIDETVLSGDVETISYTFDASTINTGTQPWTATDVQVDASFN